MGDERTPYWQLYDWDGDGDIDANDAMVYLSRHLLVRLTDPQKNPLPFAKCRIIGDPNKTVYVCDEDGVAHIPRDDWNQPGIDFEWETADAESNDPSNRFYWKKSFELAVTTMNDTECANRLLNLDFYGTSLSEQVSAYQTFFGRTPTGVLNDIREEMVTWHDGGCRPDEQISTGTIGDTFPDGQSGSAELILQDYSGNPLSYAKCRRVDGGDTETVYTADTEGLVTIPVACGTATIEIEWEPAIACNVEDGPRFYMRRTVQMN